MWIRSSCLIRSDKRTAGTAASNSRRGRAFGLRDAIWPLVITKLRLTEPLHSTRKYATAPNATDDASANMTRRKTESLRENQEGKNSGLHKDTTYSPNRLPNFASWNTGKAQQRNEGPSNICVCWNNNFAAVISERHIPSGSKLAILPIKDLSWY